jgi:hypothetical protein
MLNIKSELHIFLSTFCEILKVLRICDKNTCECDFEPPVSNLTYISFLRCIQKYKHVRFRDCVSLLHIFKHHTTSYSSFSSSYKGQVHSVADSSFACSH